MTTLPPMLPSGEIWNFKTSWMGPVLCLASHPCPCPCPCLCPCPFESFWPGTLVVSDSKIRELTVESIGLGWSRALMQPRDEGPGKGTGKVELSSTHGGQEATATTSASLVVEFDSTSFAPLGLEPRVGLSWE